MSDGLDIKVKYSSLTETANVVRAASTSLQEDLDRVMGAVKRVSETWQGEAKEMFNQVEVKWKAEAGDIKTTLEDIARLIESGSQDYHATDRKASGLFDISY